MARTISLASSISLLNHTNFSAYSIERSVKNTFYKWHFLIVWHGLQSYPIRRVFTKLSSLSVSLSPLSLSLSISLYLFFYVSLSPSLNLSRSFFLSLSVYLSICPSVTLCLSLSLCLSVRLSIGLYVCLSVCDSLCVCTIWAFRNMASREVWSCRLQPF